MTSAPLIIECAVNGATPKERNPNVPRTVEEIADVALASMDAGAAIVHNHHDDPNVGGSGRHSSEPYMQAWRRIYERRPDALLYPTMAGGGPHTDIDERYAHTDELRRAGLLRIALLDTGSLNVVGSVGGAEPDGDPLAGDLVYQNTAADVRYMVDYCNRHGLAASVSIFEPGFLRLALAHHDAGVLPRGTLIKLYFGGPDALFGLPPTAASLDAYLAMLDGSGLDWSVAVQGGDVSGGLAQAAIERGGHVRVGLEDYAGPRTPRNEELVAEVVALAEAAGRSVASPQEAARALGVPDRA